jgi:DNA ligase-1
MKTMQPSDWDENKVRFPCIIQPKIDGVRAHNPDGVLLGRSMKPIRNVYTRNLYGEPEYKFFDGELAAEDERHPELCRLTTSATSTVEGTPFTLWHAFDYLGPTQIERDYVDRLQYLHNQIAHMQNNYGSAGHLRAIPWAWCDNMDDLQLFRSRHLDEGYEGSIIRDPRGKHKQGRSTVKEMGVLRIKDFIDFEFRIEKIVEGRHNANEATINERGLTERSTHQENMIPNGMVGSLEGTVLKDVKDPQTDKVLMRAGDWVTVGPGRMPHEHRKRFFEQPHLLVGFIGKAQMFPKGIKDKPRFPTFQCLRHPDDMGE